MTAGAERQLPEFNVKNAANTARAFATSNHRDKKLFASLTAAAERQLNVNAFNVQNAANSA